MKVRLIDKNVNEEYVSWYLGTRKTRAHIHTRAHRDWFSFRLNLSVDYDILVAIIWLV